jgi:hypothetical protein
MMNAVPFPSSLMYSTVPRMFRNNLLYDWKSQAGAFGFGGFEKLKTSKSFWDPLPGIGHFQNHTVGLLVTLALKISLRPAAYVR